MAANHRTARGTIIDMDRVRLANEQTIAVGNMKVNARGDQLGAGGKIIKTRQQIMAEKNKLHKGPLADDLDVIAESMEAVSEDTVVIEIPQAQNIQPQAEETPVAESADAVPGYTKPRGSFADSVAKETNVTQELLTPNVNKNNGIQRI